VPGLTTAAPLTLLVFFAAPRRFVLLLGSSLSPHASFSGLCFWFCFVFCFSFRPQSVSPPFFLDFRIGIYQGSVACLVPRMSGYVLLIIPLSVIPFCRVKMESPSSLRAFLCLDPRSSHCTPNREGAVSTPRSVRYCTSCGIKTPSLAGRSPYGEFPPFVAQFV